MLQISDLRDTPVYQEALEEGREEGDTRRAIRTIVNMAAKNIAPEEIAAIVEVDIEFVRQVLKERAGG
jgi:predicted transposase YdaD